jgi:hypothetical protein
MTKTFRGAIPAMILVLITLAACALPEAPAPATATASPTLTPAPPTVTAAPPTRAMPTSAATGIASDPRAVVQAFIDAWARGSSGDVVNLFAEEMEYRIVLDTTDRLLLSWNVDYWMATKGKMMLRQCDLPQGNTISCDLVYESDCERLTGFGPWHWYTTFTIKHGKIEKAVATKWGPGEVEKLNELNRTVLEWAEANRPDDYAHYNAVLAGSEWGAEEAGEIVRQFCAAYGAARTPTPPPAATP